MEGYRRVQAYLTNPLGILNQYAAETTRLREEIQVARDSLKQVNLEDATAEQGLEMVKRLGIDSLRAEITLFEAARAYVAADYRQTVTPADLAIVASMALRLRRSAFIIDFLKNQAAEEEEIQSIIQSCIR